MMQILIKCALLILFAPTWVYANCPPLVTFTGEAAYDDFGMSIAVGDVNNDGIDDYIIGAPYYDGVADRSGKAYVYSGSTSELLYAFYGEAQKDNLGFSVSAGDVNNDGYTDLIVGAPNIDGVEGGIGKVYVFSGKNSDTLFVFEGEHAGSHMGISVSSTGDVDNDGYSDLVIGAHGHGSYMGRTYVFSGQTGDTLFVFEGESAGDFLGRSVSLAGDIDKDGFDDIIIGAHGYNDYTGRAYVFSGQTGDTLFVFDGESTNDEFGFSVASAGDVNNDGYLDIVIGAHGYSWYVGRVYVFSGLTGDVLYIFDSNIQGQFGFSVASAGDVDNDGFGDVIVGAYFQDGPNGSHAGRVYIYSGQDGDLLAVFSGASQFAFFGISVSPAKDINGDGFDDVLIGAFWDGVSPLQAGKVYIYSIVTCFGIRGDVNGDGIDGDMMDLIYLVDYIFRSGAKPICDSEADVNSDGTASNILDLTFLVDHIFRYGPSPGQCN